MQSPTPHHAKNRRLLVLAHFCLAAALLAGYMLHRYDGQSSWADGAAGLLIGTAIGMHLVALTRMRRGG